MSRGWVFQEKKAVKDTSCPEGFILDSFLFLK